MKRVKSMRQIKYYYNHPDYNMYYRNPDTGKFEVIEGFTPLEINSAIYHGIEVIALTKSEKEKFDM